MFHCYCFGTNKISVQIQPPHKHVLGFSLRICIVKKKLKVNEEREMRPKNKDEERERDSKKEEQEEVLARDGERARSSELIRPPIF